MRAIFVFSILCMDLAFAVTLGRADALLPNPPPQQSAPQSNILNRPYVTVQGTREKAYFALCLDGDTECYKVAADYICRQYSFQDSTSFKLAPAGCSLIYFPLIPPPNEQPGGPVEPYPVVRACTEMMAPVLKQFFDQIVCR